MVLMLLLRPRFLHLGPFMLKEGTLAKSIVNEESVPVSTKLSAPQKGATRTEAS